MSSNDDDWANTDTDTSFFEEILPPCDEVQTPGVDVIGLFKAIIDKCLIVIVYH
jgi:hypothetical protein